jgi:transposase
MVSSADPSTVSSSSGPSSSAPSPSAAPLSRSGRRRRFTAAYKLRILREAEACGPDQISALLRREALYSSHLFKWREALRKRGESGMDSVSRGPKSRRDEKDERIASLEAQLRKANAETEVLRQLVDLQKKLSDLLGVQLPSSEKPR